jgi:hypothetical protein
VDRIKRAREKVHLLISAIFRPFVIRPYEFSVFRNKPNFLT